MLEFLANLSLLSASTLFLESDFNGSRNFIFLCIGIAWIGVLVWRRIHWSAALALVWALFSGARIFAGLESPYALYGDQAAARLDLAAATACLFILIPVFLLVLAPTRVLRGAIRSFGWLCLIDSVFVLAQWTYSREFQFSRGGMFGNASADAYFIAFTYPTLMWMLPKMREPATLWEVFAQLVPIAAVVVSRSNTALAALVAAHLAPGLLHWRKAGPKVLLRVGAVIATFAVPAVLMLGTKLGSDNGRMPLWRAAGQWWLGHANPWLGTGTGTYSIFGPHAERVASGHVSHQYFIWLHNEFAQVLFEQGVVGLALFTLMIGCAARAAIRDRRTWILSSIAPYAVAMIPGYPLHLPVPALFGALLVVLAFSKRPSEVDRGIDDGGRRC